MMNRLTENLGSNPHGEQEKGEKHRHKQMSD
jgi:hypothetical protein